MSFTEEQRKAIQTLGKNLIVTAGVGSGKTRVLVERFLYLLEEDESLPLNALVAITFTREAALEMRNRVRQSLEENVKNKPDEVRWSSLLAQMDSARIDTIHGLCATILRANAPEAGIDPRFEVLEPVEATTLLSDVIDEVLHQITEADRDLAQLFTEYELWAVRDVLSNAELLSTPLEAVPETPEALLQQWQTEWEDLFVQEQRRFCNSEEILAALSWEPPVEWPRGDKLMDCFEAVDAGWNDFSQGEPAISMEAANSIIDKMNLRGGSAINWGGKEELDEAKDVLRTIRESLKKFLEIIPEPPGELDLHAAEQILRWQRLLLWVRDRYAQVKEEDGYLDFNDLEERTAQLLEKGAAVRDRYQQKEFRHVLVDEFQDTNARQWEIVKALTGLENNSSLFVVGDQKQSIYGFRGADVSVFETVKGEITDQNRGEALPLSRSFRSHPGLIESFNKLFSAVLVRDEFSPVAPYEIAFDQEMDAHRNPLPEEPAADQYDSIELLLLRNAQEHLGDEKVSAADRRLWEAQLIADRFRQLHENGALVHNKEANEYRPFDYGDAAVLFQSTTQINTYEDVFKALGIPFVTVAGRGYYNRQEVWDMLNLLRALHNPADDLSLASALRSPMFGFSDEMLLALRIPQEEDRLPLWEALQQPELSYLDEAQLELVRRAQTVLAELHRIAGRVTIADLLRQALAKTGYPAVLTGLIGGTRLRRNVEKLVEIAEDSGKVTLGDFSAYLEDLTAREVREGEATLEASGAVRLMTVHASKGLEFPVVVLADAGWERRGGGGSPLVYDSEKRQLACKVYDPAEAKFVPSFPYHRAERLKSLREDAERKRLLYVAATRARDCLIISGELRQNKTSGWTKKGWLNTIFEPLEVGDIYGMGDQSRYAYTKHGRVRVQLPHFDPDSIRSLRSGGAVTEWRKLQVQDDVETPSLLKPIVVEQEALIGHISATQLADLGGYRHARTEDERHFFRTNLRRAAFDDAPAQIQDAARVRHPRIRASQIGNVVHEALRYWRFPDETDNIESVLRSYTWQQNITDEDDVQEVIQRARILLERFQGSTIYRVMQGVRRAGLPFYAELPFIYRTEKRIVHGVIDALFRLPEGQWVVLDYKTSIVRGVDVNLDTIAEHAQRYHLQIGAYASAVSQELNGVVPRTYIHYIHHNRTVEIPEETWRSEIERLEDVIGELMGGAYVEARSG